MIEQRANYDVTGKIDLIDADLLDNGTRHPNLVIMKLSGYFKEKGCDVELIEDYSVITDDNYKGIKNYDAMTKIYVLKWRAIDTLSQQKKQNSLKESIFQNQYTVMCLKSAD